MTLKKGTIAAQIRDKIDLMHALVAAGKKDGGEFQYGEVLTLAGLPANHSYIRELSNQLIARGYRRHAMKKPKPVEIPADEALPGVLEASEDVGVFVTIEVTEIMDALNKVTDACDALFHTIEKYLPSVN